MRQGGRSEEKDDRVSSPTVIDLGWLKESRE